MGLRESAGGGVRLHLEGEDHVRLFYPCLFLAHHGGACRSHHLCWWQLLCWYCACCTVRITTFRIFSAFLLVQNAIVKIRPAGHRSCALAAQLGLRKGFVMGGRQGRQVHKFNPRCLYYVIDDDKPALSKVSLFGIVGLE